ncbi:MAG: anthranilate synthase component I [Methanosarcinaceae archaeon]|nr:anthranilate synthase component I [Methanosarcinaceae archaeon]
MIEFDLSEQEFIKLAKSVKEPSFIQLMAKIKSNEQPLTLYKSFNSSYSYLLESVEKEKRKARFSFVGENSDGVMSIKDRVLTIELLNKSNYLDFIYSKIKSKCDCTINENIIKINIKDMDVLDSIRFVFINAPILNQKRQDKPLFNGGLIGYIGYDIVYDCWIDVAKKHASDIPDIQFMIITKTFVFDHFTEDAFIVITPFIDVDRNYELEDIYRNALNDAEKMQKFIGCNNNNNNNNENEITFTNVDNRITDTNQKNYEYSVNIAKKHIIDGDIFQVVPSRKYEIVTKESPFELYLKLRKVNPSPYMYLFKFGDLSIVGASPETLMSIYENKIIINPIAGTCPRGIDEKEDEAYAKQLLEDEKERAEHVMLVDLGRNDVRMVSKSGTVIVDEFMKVVKYSHLQHIESTVSGIMRDDCDIFDATRATFPAGTLSGAPKIRAMEIINNLENSARGVYGGGVGYYSWNNDSDFAIVIRTMVIKDGIITIRAGAGIVADSNPTKEYEETERKMAAMIKAIGGK